MKIIKTASGESIRVDDEDYNQLNSVKWCIHNGYAYNGKYGSMHRFIMSAPYDMVVDHINHDRHDNRKSNLRLISSQENSIKANRQRRTSPNTKNFISDSLKTTINGYLVIRPGNIITINRPFSVWHALDDKSILIRDH